MTFKVLLGILVPLLVPLVGFASTPPPRCFCQLEGVVSKIEAKTKPSGKGPVADGQVVSFAQVKMLDEGALELGDVYKCRPFGRNVSARSYYVKDLSVGQKVKFMLNTACHQKNTPPPTDEPTLESAYPLK